MIILMLLRLSASRKKAMLALERSENKYRGMFQSMGEGFELYEILYDEKGKPYNYLLLDVNPAFETLTGLEMSKVVNKTMTEIFPQVEAYLLEKFAEVAITGEPYKYERYSKEIGINLSVNVYKPEHDKLAFIFSDITHKKLDEEVMLRQKLNFEALFRNSTDAIVLFNQRHQVVDINNKFTALFGYTIDAIKGREVDSILAPMEKSIEANQLTRDLLNGNEVAIESTRYSANGIAKDVSIKGVPVILNNQIVGGYGIYTDISERKKAEDEIIYMSYHDQLTGLYNRRFFEEELKRLDTGRNLPLSIVMADMNGLKLTNDAFGHTMGDKLLMATAEIIKQECRSDDIVARLAGDEFVILLPKTSFEEAEQIVKRIREASAKIQLNFMELSISFGWATKINIDEDMIEILKDAEDAMYRNKLFESPSIRSKTIQAIINSLYEKNQREEQHSHRVSDLCGAMGIALNRTGREVSELKNAGLLHDIGKIAIDEELLNKTSPLTNEEWNEMKRHPEIGYRILSSVNDMSELADLLLAHHEHWDGSGYPKGLKGEEIPWQARVILIADAYDAMTNERAYRAALTKEAAIEELRKNAGKQFDPEFVKVFIEKVLDKK
jgi:diguanylate cyclase (GGDEF)-like protein/PAS domain S-box-containing protein